MNTRFEKHFRELLVAALDVLRDPTASPSEKLTASEWLHKNGWSRKSPSVTPVRTKNPVRARLTKEKTCLADSPKS